VIPGTTLQYRSAVGSVDRPYAAPGETLDVTLDPRCDAAGFSTTPDDQVVTYLFRSTTTEADVVVATTDCAAIAPALASCRVRAGVRSVSCVTGPPADGGLTILSPDRARLTFPDTDAILRECAGDGAVRPSCVCERSDGDGATCTRHIGCPGATCTVGGNDERTLAGPVAIAVTSRTSPLPCDVARDGCTAREGLLACIDELRDPTEGCLGSLHGVFDGFTALPPPNVYAAACTAETPPCSGAASEIRAAIDRDGNVLVPMDWTDVLVRVDDVPFPREVQAGLATPVPVSLPDRKFVRSYTPEGGLLHPIFEPERAATSAPTLLNLFGLVDAPYTILRIGRGVGRCADGVSQVDRCNLDADCGSGTCDPVCNGGPNDGDACQSAGECPSGICGTLFDLSPFRQPAGPLVLSRSRPAGLPGVCESRPSQPCASALGCPGASACVGVALQARSSVSLEGLVEGDSLLGLVAEETVTQQGVPRRDRNQDGDTLDSVVTTRDRSTGVVAALPPLTACTPRGPARSAIRVRVPPFSFPAVVVADSPANVLAVLESESAEGRCNANGDGDRRDPIFRIFRATGTAVTTDALVADALPVIDGQPIAISGVRAFFRRSESGSARQQTVRASLTTSGAQSARDSFAPAISGDGRYIAFISRSPTQFDSQVRVRDTQATGSVGLGEGFSPAISADGQWAAFLAPSEDGPLQVVLRDTAAITTARILTIGFDGQPGNDTSQSPRISADGTLVAFDSTATNLVPGDEPNTGNLFVVVGATSGNPSIQRIEAAPPDPARNGPTVEDMSADGRFIVFSYRVFIDPGFVPTFGPAPAGSLHLYDRLLDRREQIDVSSSGASGNDQSGPAAVSDDGRYVVFETLATNLVPGIAPGFRIVVRDRVLATTELVSVRTGGEPFTGRSQAPSISADGRYVTFQNNNGEVLLHDRLTGVTDVVTSGAANPDPQISADGRFVAFASGADDLVASDTNERVDVFRRGPDRNDTESDLFADGALDDEVLTVVDTTTGGRTSLCPATRVATAGGLAAFLRPESNTGTTRCPGGSLNGDSDVADQVVHLWTGGTTPRNLGLAATDVALSRTTIAALADEAGQTLNDLNGDGDAIDRVLMLLDVTGGGWINTGTAADDIQLAGDCVAFRIPERDEGNQDLNGDGDLDDGIVAIALRDAAGSHVERLGRPAVDLVLGESAPSPCGTVQLLAYRVHECAESGAGPCPRGGQDLNGDGDADDDVLEIYDAVTQTRLATGVAVTPCELQACDPRRPYRVARHLVRFLTDERDQGPLNDDGRLGLVRQEVDFCTRTVTTLGPIVDAPGADPLMAGREDDQPFVTSTGRCRGADDRFLLVPSTCDPHAAGGGDCPAGASCVESAVVVGAPHRCVNVACGAPDGCNFPGTCDARSGQCRARPLGDGTTCDDGDPSTSGDHCEGGRCAGSSPSTTTSTTLPVTISPLQCLARERPRPINKRLTRAMKLIDRAAVRTCPTDGPSGDPCCLDRLRRKLLKRALRTLRPVDRIVGKRLRKRRLSEDCAAAIRLDAGALTGRASALGAVTGCTR
jgi:Tol biopolymer transport system component